MVNSKIFLEVNSSVNGQKDVEDGQSVSRPHTPRVPAEVGLGDPRRRVDPRNSKTPKSRTETFHPSNCQWGLPTTPQVYSTMLLSKVGPWVLVSFNEKQ